MDLTKLYIKNLSYGASDLIFERARFLKSRMTDVEKILWEHLRNRKLDGYKFRRQHPILHFIADFYCHELKLVIELDGGIHHKKEVREHDEGRTAEMGNYELTVLCFKNEEIYSKPESVLEEIRKLCRSLDRNL